MSRCHWLLHIPSDDGYPALNLAQAVAICLYELRLAVFDQDAVTPCVPGADFALQERMFAELEQSLSAIHYLYGAKTQPLMHGIRHLLGRAQLTEMEVKLLMGLARQIRWFVENKR